jgi:hypothetical protein
MLLRKIAKELGVSHTLLVLWQQGKRNLDPELAQRYYKLSASNSQAKPEGAILSPPRLPFRHPGSCSSGSPCQRRHTWPLE